MTGLLGMILRQVVSLGKDSVSPRPDHNKNALITPAQFYSRRQEKTKLNWFCFEYALELEKTIKTDRRLLSKLTGKGVDDAKIAAFCIHFAKYMKGEVMAQVSGRIPQVRIRYEPIESFFPSIGDALVDRILTISAKAWDSHTACCIVCPTRCISEKEQRATMFDDPFYWG